MRQLLGPDATKRATKEAMHSADVIHLATHGTPSGVLLSAPTRSEGILSMAEVQTMRLRARLVVLSECDSFRGELRADGLVGITRAFLSAGALAIVASLWKVDDDGTRELMTRFYARLLGEAAGDAAAAMQGAMISMLHDARSHYRNVLLWAAFLVCGLTTRDVAASQPEEDDDLAAAIRLSLELPTPSQTSSETLTPIPRQSVTSPRMMPRSRHTA